VAQAYSLAKQGLLRKAWPLVTPTTPNR